ncbi:uncharacterized protein LOC142590152 [Dermacentor variabilis]|uniref:uncharacterized protein LOC142590152 n=1 Tax=Dermacentor variabilis TaxID=34621 RepID=UPI003F5C7678
MMCLGALAMVRHASVAVDAANEQAQYLAKNLPDVLTKPSQDLALIAGTNIDEFSKAIDQRIKDCSEEAASMVDEVVDNSALLKFVATTAKRCSDSRKTVFTKVPSGNLTSPAGVKGSPVVQLFVGMHRRLSGIFFSDEIPEAVPTGAPVAGASYLHRVRPVTHRGCSALWTCGTPKALQGEARRKRNHFHQSPRLCWQDSILALDTASMPYDDVSRSTSNGAARIGGCGRRQRAGAVPGQELASCLNKAVTGLGFNSRDEHRRVLKGN